MKTLNIILISVIILLKTCLAWGIDFSPTVKKMDSQRRQYNYRPEDGAKFLIGLMKAQFEAQFQNADEIERWTHLKDGDAMVQVTGHLRGTGIIILIDGHPKILTNSHVLAGNKTGIVQFFGLQKILQAAVEFDNPLADIAILNPLSSDPVSDPDFLETLIALGRTTVNFCKSSDLSCDRGMQWEFPESKINVPFVVAFADSHLMNAFPIAPWSSSLVEDNYISGLYSHIIITPIFGRPGMSGGALFERLHFRGLITKVQMDATPMVYSIPVEEIASIVTRHYFKKGNENALKGEWNIKPESMTLEVYDGENFIEAGTISGTIQSSGGELGSGGGELGSGGGELGSGGDSLDEASYWVIKSDLLSLNPQMILEHSDLLTANPFKHKKSLLKVNGQSVAFIADQDSIATPSLARLIRLHSQSASFQIVTKGLVAEEKLAQRRIKFLSGIAKPQYSRYYLKPKANEPKNQITIPSSERGNAFVLDNTFSFSFNHFNPLENKLVDLLFPENNAMKEMAHNMEPMSLNLAKAQYRLDQNSYTQTYPFQVKNNPQMALDIRFLENSSELDFFIPYSLEEMSLYLKKDSQDQNPKLIKFKRVSKHDEISLRFEADVEGYRAVMIFNEADLGKLERIYIDTPDKIFEFISCSIGKECIR